MQNGNVIVHPQEKAESFNKYFNSTFTSSSPSVALDIDNLQPPHDSISQIEITRSDVFEALCSLDPTKSLGCDNIHPHVLKHLYLNQYITFSNKYSTTRMEDTQDHPIA